MSPQPATATGPRTPEGKLIVSQNARKLGLFISDSTLELEDPQELADLLAGYTADYNPRGAIEQELLRQLAIATHRLRRLERIETAVLFSEEIAHTRHEGGLILANRFTSESITLEKIARVRTTTERTFARIYNELELRKSRRFVKRIPEPQLEIEVDTRHQPIKRPVRPTADIAVAAGSLKQTNELQNKLPHPSTTGVSSPTIETEGSKEGSV
jgi:hypothetical protein